MISRKQIEIEVLRLEALDSVARAYSQIASLKMKRIRTSVLTTRDFLESLNSIFLEVLDSYQREAQKISRRKRGKKGKTITFLAHNGRKVAVFLSSNSGLYGDLIVRTFNEFIGKVRSGEYEATIVGQTGLAMFEQQEPDRPFTYFDLPDGVYDPLKLASLVKHLVAYDEIVIYYPKFENVVRQTPSQSTISAGTQILDHTKREKINYIFEPDLETILIFFETEIFGSVFQQTVSESQLAKFASRMLSLDKAAEKIDKKLNEVKVDKLKFAHRLSNKKQLHALGGISLWGRGI